MALRRASTSGLAEAPHDVQRPFADEDASTAAVDLRQLSRLFGPTAGLARVSLRIEVGQVVVLRGPNGAGKSTLLRVVATELASTFGTGTVLGFDLERQRVQIRRRLEFLGHRFRLYEDLTVEENLRFWVTMYGIGRDVDIGSALAQVGLAERAARPAGSLSQGMRQRLALARAAVRQPELLLLDEPYAGLDEDGKDAVDRLVAAARAARRTVILATHDLSRTLPLVDRVITMRGGAVFSDKPSPRERMAR